MTLTPTEFNQLCNELLSGLEIQEARLLSWGFINGSLPLGDINTLLPVLLKHLRDNSPEVELLWQRAKQEGVTGVQMLKNLEDRRLIFRGGEERYRTRFAETIRALFLLRQRFSAEDWNTGDRLVGDLKLFLQRRQYPRREIAAAALFERLAPLNLSSLRTEVIQSLLQERGRELTLANFQAQAIFRILRNLESPDDSAVVIGAGTGAGKTKAFYIPALAAIAEKLSAARWVQALALYPRTELLKDQLRETYAEARKLDSLLAQSGKRAITVGAYYGDVPKDAADILQGRRENWHRTRDRMGWICPYVPCPACERQSMVWSKDDLELEQADNQRKIYGNYARLTCDSCYETIDKATLLLTREQMVQQPPDLLFTTTEMLNRRLCHVAERRLFGVATETPPSLLLLDEIHLNEGIHGAQIAYLLRRWCHGRRQQSSKSASKGVSKGVCIVGLSATLAQAELFFARLTGIPAEHVTYIAPSDADMVKEGIEYNVVLKGDPVAGTALLSTSVRTAMLLCRALDPMQANKKPSVSGGTWGQRVFAFSDKLDVINRWYHIEKEVENPAEPFSRFLFVEPRAKDERARYDQGQNWSFISRLHGDATVLTSGLRLGLTSSQYAGVDDRANLVIASSTLEVGYNDPTVGAILQHKAPYSRAAFVQRKGRAGRTRMMRPWTVLVTSAYGHDRWAFQHAESLFDPLLPPLDLPIENYYVRKIQAVYTLLDWLATMMARDGATVDLWRLLSSDQYSRSASLYEARQKLVKLLLRLLEDGDFLEEFKQHLIDTLQLGEGENYANADYIADTLFWGEPRPLILEVIPTALRQLETSWRSVRAIDAPIDSPTNEAGWRYDLWDDSIANRPLPDFIPSALFSDLKSPDVLIRIPERRVRPGEKLVIRDEESMSVALAMSEYAPGKVNKRFALKDKIRESHWLELPSNELIHNGVVNLADLAMSFDPFSPTVTIDGLEYHVNCPRTMTLTTLPSHVRTTSSALFLWRSRFTSHSRQQDGSSGLPISLRPSSLLNRLFTAIASYSQANGSWVNVTRAATGVHVSTKYEGGGERRGRFRFSANEEAVAIGYAVDVDALQFAYQPLPVQELRANAAWPALYQRFAAQFFHHLLATDGRVDALGLSDFELEWLWQISLTMVVLAAVEHQIALCDAAPLVMSKCVESARQTLQIIFDVSDKSSKQPAKRPIHEPQENGPDFDDEREEHPVEPSVRDLDATDPSQDIGYLHAKLLALMGNSNVQGLIAEYLPVLWQDNHPKLDTWLTSVYAFSLGSALYTTLLETAPDIQSDDIHWDVDEEEQCVWISESAAGGVGLIARLADHIAQHPRHFEMAFLRTLRTCPRAQLAEKLNQVATLIRAGDAGLAEAFATARVAIDLPRVDKTRRLLTSVLDSHGIATTRQLGVAINMKFLRPSSGADTDKLVAILAEFWHSEQERLGCAIDLRVIAAAATQTPTIKTMVSQVLSRVGEQRSDALEGQNYNQLLSFLWLECHDGCPDCIEHSQRYQAGPKPSRAMLALLLASHESAIDITMANWQESALVGLAENYQVQIICHHDTLSAAVRATANLLALPIDVGSQLLYPAIERVERNGHNWHIYLVLSELIGA